jgi:threonylcarbamoyladenosine tRNA methylthiotransferase MtaB
VRLANLVERLAELPGTFRLRLSSLEATEVTRELIAVMAAYPQRVVPHLHVCLQSGSDAVLRRMRRRWSSRMIIDRCQLIRQMLDQPALTSDCIVGFPGETEEDFQATCRVAAECGFSKIHIFPFSPRQGTPAATMPQQVPAEVKQDRCRRLAAVAQQLRAAYFRALLGRRLEVLVEGPSPLRDGGWVGTSCRYAPVHGVGGDLRAGDLTWCRVEDVCEDGLIGVPA